LSSSFGKVSFGEQTFGGLAVKVVPVLELPVETSLSRDFRTVDFLSVVLPEESASIPTLADPSIPQLGIAITIEKTFMFPLQNVIINIDRESLTFQLLNQVITIESVTPKITFTLS